MREFSQANDIKLRHEIASKDQAITRLTLENERLKNEKMELERNYITMQKEFDGAILRNAQVNQQMVEFRLRGMSQNCFIELTNFYFILQITLVSLMYTSFCIMQDST